MLNMESRNLRGHSPPKKNSQGTLKDLGLNTKLKCAKTGNLLAFALLNKAAHLLTDKKNLTQDKIFLRTTRLNFARDSMKNFIALMDLDANSSIQMIRPKMTTTINQELLQQLSHPQLQAATLLPASPNLHSLILRT